MACTGADSNASLFFDTPITPVNNAYKFFIANVDFSYTATDVKSFFAQFGAVNYVKLVPHHSNNGWENNAGKQKHKGYGFLFMLDAMGTEVLEKYANAFPDNKIEMLGRKGVLVRRQEGMGPSNGHQPSGYGGRANNAGVNRNNGQNWQQQQQQHNSNDGHQRQWYGAGHDAAQHPVIGSAAIAGTAYDYSQQQGGYYNAANGQVQNSAQVYNEGPPQALQQNTTANTVAQSHPAIPSYSAQPQHQPLVPSQSTLMTLQSSGEIETATLRVSAAKRWRNSATDMVESLQHQLELAQKQLEDSQKEWEDAELCLRDVHKKYEVIDVSADDEQKGTCAITECGGSAGGMSWKRKRVSPSPEYEEGEKNKKTCSFNTAATTAGASTGSTATD